MQSFFELINANSSTLLMANFIISILLVLFLIVVLVKQARLSKKYNKLVRGMDNKNLEEILHAHISRVGQVVEEVNQVSEAYNRLNSMVEKSLQKVGTVRFNAFADTGSDLSFAVALLDNAGDGIVVSSIFGRDDQRTYAKPIKNGMSSYHLSEEEVKAIKIALQQK